MKITYLVNERQADGSLVLVETTSAHWHRIVAANKTAPANERRYFYADILSDNYNLDCIVMEVSKEQHAAWNSERRSARRNRDAAKAYTVLSLEELVESHSAALPSVECQEEALISSVVIGELKKSPGCMEYLGNRGARDVPVRKKLHGCKVSDGQLWPFTKDCLS